MKKTLSLLLLLGSLAYAMDESPQMVRVFIKTIWGSTIAIVINESTTVSDLKRTIEKNEGIPVANQAIILAGKELNPQDRLIKDIDIQKYATMHLIPKRPAAKRFNFTQRQKIGAVLTTAIPSCCRCRSNEDTYV